MKTKFLSFFLAIIICSCGQKVAEETLIDFKPNENVASFKVAKILNDEYADKHPDSLFAKNFDSKTDTIKYTEKEIYISYITSLNGCGKYEGDISIERDSLLLKLVQINNMSCTELNIARVVFRIKNPKSRQYKIAKD